MQNDLTLAPEPRFSRTLPVGEFLALVQGVSEACFTPATLAELLDGVQIDDESLQPYYHWQSRAYTRNLLFKNAIFELLAVCWEPGSKSPVHDHAGQDCWLTVHSGALALDSYELVDPTHMGRIGDGIALRQVGGRQRVEAYGIDHRGPNQDIHRVSNPLEYGGRAVSVHIYAKPINACTVYDTQRHTATTRQMSYFSVDGVPI